MKYNDALQIEQMLDKHDTSSLESEYEAQLEANAAVREAYDHAVLTRKALRLVLKSTTLNTNIAENVLRTINRSKQESRWQAVFGRLSDWLYIPSVRWAAAFAVLLCILAPLGYFTEYTGLPSQNAEIGSEHLDSGLSGATILVQVHQDEDGNKQEIVWVIGGEGQSL